MVIETERLLLREMNDDDFHALYKVLADSEIMQHYPYAFDENRVRNWIARNIERYRVFGFGLWAVCLKETGEMIGDCGLTMQLIGGQIKPEIGYHIIRSITKHKKWQPSANHSAAFVLRPLLFRLFDFIFLKCINLILGRKIGNLRTVTIIAGFNLICHIFLFIQLRPVASDQHHTILGGSAADTAACRIADKQLFAGLIIFPAIIEHKYKILLFTHVSL